jgi:hypothetical protein
VIFVFLSADIADLLCSSYLSFFGGLTGGIGLDCRTGGSSASYARFGFGVAGCGNCGFYSFAIVNLPSIGY